jgi:hypothetical protein
MSTSGAAFSSDASGVRTSDEVTTHGPVAVQSCSRLGRVANPPSFSFTDWFRARRR